MEIVFHFNAGSYDYKYKHGSTPDTHGNWRHRSKFLRLRSRSLRGRCRNRSPHLWMKPSDGDGRLVQRRVLLLVIGHRARTVEGHELLGLCGGRLAGLPKVHQNGHDSDGNLQQFM